jgi:hypothetical protein
MHVFLLWHVRELPSGEENAKLIGVYSTRLMAEAAQQRARLLPGFRELPDAFMIDDYLLDRDHWQEGCGTTESDSEQNT